MWLQDEHNELAIRWYDKNKASETVMSKMRANKELSHYRYRPDIQSAADRAGITFKVNRELKGLASRLRDNEIVLQLAPVTHEDSRGLLVITDERIIFIFQGWIYRHTFSYDHARIVQSVWKPGRLLGTLKIKLYSGSLLRFQRVWCPVGASMVTQLESIVKNISSSMRDEFELSGGRKTEKVMRQIRSEHLVADQIDILEKAYKEGAIEQSDYIKQKMELLHSL